MQDIILCPRCSTPCKKSTPINKDARLLLHTSRSDGLCPNCAVTEFLLGVEPVRAGIEKHGVEKALSNTAVREQFVAVMRAGGADMQPNEINWEKVIRNWSLPFPSHRKHGIA